VHKRVLGIVIAVITMMSGSAPTRAQSQSLTTELDLTAGYSSEDHVGAVAGQLRAFGELKSLGRFNVEGTWARRSGDETDAFGAAYPYGGRLQLSEAYGERTFQRGSWVTGVRLGRQRTPFGISGRSDYAYSGFLRAPLIRYDGYWALTNSFLEQGADIIVGTPRVSVEASLGVPGDIGITNRRSGLDRVVRVQGYHRGLIVGVSHIDSEPYYPATWAKGRLEFNGVDVRLMVAGIQFRGEWIAGQPWNGPTTDGGYVDAIIHRPFMGPVTAVLRAERLNYLSSVPFKWHDEAYTDWHAHRETAGGRIRLPRGFTAQVDVVRQSRELTEHERTALDVALTYSIRRQ
jgi:hypothetical protein